MGVLNKSSIDNNFSTQTGLVLDDINNVLAIVSDTSFVGQIRKYTSLSSVLVDFTETDEAYLLAVKHFQQIDDSVTPPISPPPLLITDNGADATSGTNLAGDTAAWILGNFTPIANGGFDITIDGILYQTAGLDFSAATGVNQIVGIIDASLTSATVTIDQGTGRLLITSNSTGSSSSVSAIAVSTAGGATDISILISSGTDIITLGVDADTPVARLQAIENDVSNTFEFAIVVLDSTFIITQDIIDCIVYANGLQKYMVFHYFLTVADIDLYEGYEKGVFYSESSASRYDDAMASIMLSNPIGALTPKFRIPKGVSPVQLTTTDLDTIITKGGNVYTSVGEKSGEAFIKEGVANVTSSGVVEYIDSVLGKIWLNRALLKNLQNLLLTNGKIPLDARGTAKIGLIIESVFSQAFNQGIVNENSAGGIGLQYSVNISEVINRGIEADIEYLDGEAVHFITNNIIKKIGGS